MQIRKPSEHRLEFLHEGKPLLRYGSLLVLLLVVVAVALSWGRSWPGVLAALAAGGFFLWLLRSTSADSRAVFDRTTGRFQLTHSRNGRPLGQEEAELGAVRRVIVDVAAGGGGAERLAMRPALWIEGGLVPLTWRDFAVGEAPREIAETIRRFLGLPDTDLIDDSLEVLARQPRIQPAVRLARIGKGLGRVEALRAVRALRGEKPAS